MDELRRLYVASYGGKYELAGKIEGIETLVQEGYLSSSRCNKDPLSNHGAKTCRITLTRLTDKGVSEAKSYIEYQFRSTDKFLEALNSHPQKIRDVYRVLLKQWLEACESGSPYNWIVRNRKADRGIYLRLPETVKEAISKLTSLLVEKGLAAKAPIHHTTGGPSDPVLMTCPEIKDWILLPRENVKSAVLDEYLKYLLDGLSMAMAKDHLLFRFNSDADKITADRLRHVSWRFGVPQNLLLDWLEELENRGYISRFNRNAIKVMPSHERFYGDDFVAVGNPWNYHPNPRDDIEKIEAEVKNNLVEWFENGVEKFMHFYLRTY